MKSIAFLLEGMELVSSHMKVVERIQEFFLEKFSEEVAVKYEKGKVFLQMSPVLRSEVFLRKKSILSEINEGLEEFNVKIQRII